MRVHKVKLYEMSCNNVYQITYICNVPMRINPKQITVDDGCVTCKNCLKVIEREAKK